MRRRTAYPAEEGKEKEVTADGVELITQWSASSAQMIGGVHTMGKLPEIYIPGGLTMRIILCIADVELRLFGV